MRTSHSRSISPTAADFCATLPVDRLIANAEEAFPAISEAKPPAEKIPLSALIARCRLKDAKRWFALQGWDVLSQNERGSLILQWGADHAWLAASGSPEKSVRRWCKRHDPRLTASELNKIVEETAQSNKRWSDDQCAAVLCITVEDREKHQLWHIGANDDPNHDVRRAIARAKSAERSRRYRAKHRTGAKRGRPAAPRLSEDEKLARRRAQGAERARKFRASRKAASRGLIVKPLDGVTDASVTHDRPPARSAQAKARGGRPRLPIGKPLVFGSTNSIRVENETRHVAEQTRETRDDTAQTAAHDDGERRRLQDQARLLLNAVTAAMMRAEDPSIWQPLLVAATSEWHGHNLLDDDERDGERQLLTVGASNERSVRAETQPGRPARADRCGAAG